MREFICMDTAMISVYYSKHWIHGWIHNLKFIYDFIIIKPWHEFLYELIHVNSDIWLSLNANSSLSSCEFMHYFMTINSSWYATLHDLWIQICIYVDEEYSKTMNEFRWYKVPTGRFNLKFKLYSGLASLRGPGGSGQASLGPWPGVLACGLVQQ